MIWISDGKQADVSILDELVPEPGAFYVMDRGYRGFSTAFWLCGWSAPSLSPAPKPPCISAVCVAQVNKRSRRAQRSDHPAHLAQSAEHYPDACAASSYKDPETGNVLVFLTNNFDLPALTIAQLYKGRWQVELFFKWIKQNLRIKHFFGTTDNAVKTQVWIAICVYVLVAIVRKELGLEISLSQIATDFERERVLSKCLWQNSLQKPNLRIMSTILITS